MRRFLSRYLLWGKAESESMKKATFELKFQKSVSPHHVLSLVRISFIASFFMITVLATNTIINYIACPVEVTGVITTASFIFYNHKVNFLSLVRKIGGRMTTKDVKQNQLTTRETRWKQMAWTIYKVDDQGKYKTTFERYDDHLVMTVPFADASQEKAEEVKQRVLSNETSPIEYFMYKMLLDPKALAQAMGIAVWRLKRHFKPNVFKKLDQNKLQKYAKTLKVKVEDLIDFREDA